MKENRLISSQDVNGIRTREDGEARSRAAQHQATPVYELNSTKSTRNFNGSRPEGYSVKEYIESIKRTKRTS